MPKKQETNGVAFNAAALRRLRRERDLTQGDVAGRLGVTVAAVSAWEGGAKVPNWERACQLAAALGVSLDEFRA